jgi:hypothetical protein
LETGEVYAGRLISLDDGYATFTLECNQETVSLKYHYVFINNQCSPRIQYSDSGDGETGCSIDPVEYDYSLEGAKVWYEVSGPYEESHGAYALGSISYADNVLEGIGVVSGDYYTFHRKDIGSISSRIDCLFWDFIN